MIKRIAWNIFKNTGDINTFLELKQIQDIEEKIGNEIQQMEEQNGNNKDEWYNNI